MIIFVVYPKKYKGKKVNRDKLWQYADVSVESFTSETRAERYAEAIDGFVSEQSADNEVYYTVRRNQPTVKDIEEIEDKPKRCEDCGVTLTLDEELEDGYCCQCEEIRRPSKPL